jgi:hypothetical protein
VKNQGNKGEHMKLVKVNTEVRETEEEKGNKGLMALLIVTAIIIVLI